MKKNDMGFKGKTGGQLLEMNAVKYDTASCKYQVLK